MEKLFRTNQGSGLLPPLSFAKMVSKYDDRVLSRFFPKNKVAELKNLAKIGNRLQTAEQIAGNPSGSGQTVMTWGSLGMILRSPIKGTAIVIAPKPMAKLYLSKNGMKWLTDGFGTRLDSKKGIELATKLLALTAQKE